ncbi:MAG: hypothetical protein ACREFO_04250, partial [Acetobacteraceae bacterium]
ILAAALQLQPLFWTADGIKARLTAATSEPVEVLRFVPASLASLLSRYPLAGNAGLTIVPLLLGIALLAKPNRLTGVLAAVFLVVVWWWGQDFGTLTTTGTGVSTDPDSAPLVFLLLLPLFLRSRAAGDPASRRRGCLRRGARGRAREPIPADHHGHPEHVRYGPAHIWPTGSPRR